LTVMRSAGNAKPALRIALRTRSRLSRTAESGSRPHCRDRTASRQCRGSDTPRRARTLAGGPGMGARRVMVTDVHRRVGRTLAAVSGSGSC
jgi:hypothetical protein